jgi:hypothetical protein
MVAVESGNVHEADSEEIALAALTARRKLLASSRQAASTW